MIAPEHLCQRAGCARAATHALKVCVPGVDSPEDAPPVADALIGVRVCEEHLDDEDGQRWVTGDPGKAIRPLIAMAAMGAGAMPAFDRAWVVGVPLDSQEVRSMPLHVPKVH